MAGGRPPIVTPEIVTKLEHAFALGCTDLEACFYADISKTALYNYQDANPGFKDRKESLKQSPTFIARTTVVREMAGDGALALKYLERKLKNEFSPSSDVNLGGQKDNPVVVKDDQQSESRIAELLRKAGIAGTAGSETTSADKE